MKKSINITTYLLKRISVVGMIIFLGVTQYASAQVEAYPSTSESLISRVGSLVLAPTVSAITLGSSYVNSFARCEKNDNTVAATRTCLDVQGTGSFSNLIANNLRTFLLEKTFVGPAAGVGPGVQTVPLFIDDTVATNDSLMVSDLGRFNVSGQFAPVDTTTMRGVCADANGIFYACAVPESPVSTCPLTFTDTDTNIVYPIVDVDGACWFGRDLQRNQVNDINAGHIYSFMNDAKFKSVSTSTGPFAMPFTAAGNELTADIVFVDHGGTTKVVYSSSNYLPATSALPSPYAGDGTYHSINSVFKSFLLDTCDWSTANMVNHTWGGSENYYIIDLQVAQHNEALGSDSYIKPTYNISCREYIDTDSVDPSFDLIKWENFDTNRAESNEFHVNVYTIAEPQMADVINKNKGVFVHVEDIYDYTCPTGWHVPRTAEWDHLETALTTRATAEGTTLSGSTLAAEMKFNPSGYGVAPSPSSGPSYEYRYHVRELVDVVTGIGGASSYNEVRRDGYNILTAAGNITFDPAYVWQKRFATWRYWYITGPYISATTPATLFARVIDLLKINSAYALPSGSGDELAGKVRCVRGTELTTSIGGWGSCINVDGQWTQTYVVSSCSIGGHSVPVSNCSATSADGPVPGETRSCIPAAPGGGGKVEKL